MSLTKANFRMIDGSVVNVLDFGAVGDGVTDDTVALQEAVDFANPDGKVVRMPTGTYLITDTIDMDRRAQISGDLHGQGTAYGTIIEFAPTTAKSLFATTDATALKDGFLIENMLINGNSADAAGNSIYAIDVDNIIKSVFRNLRILNFRTAIRCFATINNRFEYVHTSNGYIASVLYDGGIATTDVWEQCYFHSAPIGIQTNGQSLGIRFNSCIFEQLSTYGVNLVRECFSWMFNDTYVENVPVDNIATNAMWRVGFDGVTLAGSPAQLIINGGHIGGRTAGGVGSMLTVDFTDGILLGGFSVNRYTNVIETSANTQTAQIVSSGFVSSVATMATELEKVEGSLPLQGFNSGTRNLQAARFGSVTFANDPTSQLNDYREYTSTNAACTGAITADAIWQVTKVGNMCTLVLPGVFGIGSAATNFEFGEKLALSFRPAAIVMSACSIKDAGANIDVPGQVWVLTDGSIRVYKTLSAAGLFSAGGNAGMGNSVGTSISWTI